MQAGGGVVIPKDNSVLVDRLVVFDMITHRIGDAEEELGECGGVIPFAQDLLDDAKEVEQIFVGQNVLGLWVMVVCFSTKECACIAGLAHRCICIYVYVYVY